MREIGSINQRFDVIRKWTRHIDPPQQFYSATRDPDSPVRIQENPPFECVRRSLGLHATSVIFARRKSTGILLSFDFVRLANSHHEFTLRCSVFANGSLVILLIATTGG